ncbi:MAG: secondary thiamine-phosphate synthase enzyme YjbQ [Pseudomonadota bacterium]
MRVETLADGAVTRVVHGSLLTDTSGEGFLDITAPIGRWLTGIGAGEGVLSVFVRHTTASLTVQENADPRVLADLVDGLDRVAPRSARYRHSEEGPDDMPGHIKAMLCGPSLTLPVVDGALHWGAWQNIYLIEHRDAPREREVLLSFLGN